MNLKLLVFVALTAFITVSCEYQEIADADYPEQTIYMPTATGGNYVINSAVISTVNSPTTGAPYRFKADLTSKKFIVPLSVFRGGVNNAGKFSVTITVNADTINQLIANGKLSGTELLPADKYSVPASVEVVSDTNYSLFELAIDLEYFRANPNKKYAVAVGISSIERKVNKALATTIVVVETKIMVPTASFTTKADAANTKKITFTNTSANGVNYLWNFGDGTTTSTEKSPIHTFAAAGTYSVTLTTTGITGDVDKVTKTSDVIVQ